MHLHPLKHLVIISVTMYLNFFFEKNKIKLVEIIHYQKIQPNPLQRAVNCSKEAQIS